MNFQVFTDHSLGSFESTEKVMLFSQDNNSRAEKHLCNKICYNDIYRYGFTYTEKRRVKDQFYQCTRTWCIAKKVHIINFSMSINLYRHISAARWQDIVDLSTIYFAALACVLHVQFSMVSMCQKRKISKCKSRFSIF